MDVIFKVFLEQQLVEGMALAKASDLLELTPLADDGAPPQRYLAHFSCTGLVRSPEGSIVEANDFLVGIAFPSDYLRILPTEGLTFRVLRWLAPRNVFHPNISDKVPLICIGQVCGGTSLVDILEQLFEVITYNKVNTADGLNAAACAWARRNMDLIPIDRRSLRRVAPSFELEETDGGRGAVSGAQR